MCLLHMLLLLLFHSTYRLQKGRRLRLGRLQPQLWVQIVSPAQGRVALL